LSLFFFVGIRLALKSLKIIEGVENEHDDKRVSLIQFIYKLAYHFWRFCISKNFEKAVGGLVIHYKKTEKVAPFLPKFSVE
jgi:hypothetical protein